MLKWKQIEMIKVEIIKMEILIFKFYSFKELYPFTLNPN